MSLGAQTSSETAAIADAGDPGQPVITMHGLCPGDAGKVGADCVTVITRAEFERLTSALDPKMSDNSKRQFAQSYAQLLARAAAARRAGLENTESFRREMDFARLRLLEQAFNRELQARFETISQEDVERFYRENRDRYEELTLRRIFIPHTLPEQGGPEAALKLAEQIRARAAKGEDADQLQAEIFRTARMEVPPPSTVIGQKRRNSLLPHHEAELFRLQAGDVSGIFREPNGFFIYVVEARRHLPLEQVEVEVRRTIHGERFNAAMQEVHESVRPEFNESYFGAGAARQ